MILSSSSTSSSSSSSSSSSWGGLGKAWVMLGECFGEARGGLGRLGEGSVLKLCCCTLKHACSLGSNMSLPFFARSARATTSHSTYHLYGPRFLPNSGFDGFHLVSLPPVAPKASCADDPVSTQLTIAFLEDIECIEVPEANIWQCLERQPHLHCGLP